MFSVDRIYAQRNSIGFPDADRRSEHDINCNVKIMSEGGRRHNLWYRWLFIIDIDGNPAVKHGQNLISPVKSD